MNRDQVFLAVLTGVVACGPKFKARQPGQCGPAEVDYQKMIKITENVTNAVMKSTAVERHSSAKSWLGDLVKLDAERRLLADESANENIVGQLNEVIKGRNDEIAQLRAELNTIEDTAGRHQTTAMRHKAELDRLKNELQESKLNYSEAYKRIEAKEMKILELEAEIGRLERENDLMRKNSITASQITAIQGWLTENEVFANEIENLKSQIKAYQDGSEIDGLRSRVVEQAKEIVELHAQKKRLTETVEAMKKHADERRLAQVKLSDEIIRLQSDKDALRKAVEDGAMEIERLKNTLKGVEQIAAMKPEDVEMLKADGGVISTGGTWFQIQPSNPVVDIKNDLSSAVSNSTEGQRVVVEDLEATVEEPEWVTQDRVPARPTDERQWVRVDNGSVSIGNRWASVKEIRTVENFGPVSHGFVDRLHRLELRCRPEDLPVTAPAKIRWVEITKGSHVLGDGDYCIPIDEFVSIDDDNGWLPARVCDLERQRVEDHDAEYRFRRIAAESSP